MKKIFILIEFVTNLRKIFFIMINYGQNFYIVILIVLKCVSIIINVI